MIDDHPRSKHRALQVFQRQTGIELQLIKESDPAGAGNHRLHRKIIVVDKSLSRQICDQSRAANRKQIPRIRRLIAADEAAFANRTTVELRQVSSSKLCENTSFGVSVNLRAIRTCDSSCPSFSKTAGHTC